MQKPFTDLDLSDLQRVIAQALAEDIGTGDITSQLTIPADAEASMQFIACEALVACGTFLPEAVYGQIGKTAIEARVSEGEFLAPETTMIIVTGPARLLLLGERVTLNLMQRLAGVATLTRRYVEAVKGTKAVILDTRKTMPGLRQLDKYAVRVGGGQNHRMRLDDMVLIKDNHIAVCGSIMQAVQKARAGTTLPIEVECDTLAQVGEALRAEADRIMLDNMDLHNLRKAVEMVSGRIPLEASGGVSLESAQAIAETGVDYISVGELTHSAPAADIRADMAIKARS